MLKPVKSFSFRRPGGHTVDSRPLSRSGHGADGGEAGRVHPELHPGERPPPGRRGPQLHPPPDRRAVQGLPDQIARGPDNQRVLLRAAGEPGEAVARRECWQVKDGPPDPGLAFTYFLFLAARLTSARRARSSLS